MKMIFTVRPTFAFAWIVKDNAANLCTFILSEVRLPVDLLLSSFVKGSCSCGKSLLEWTDLFYIKKDLKYIWERLVLFEFIVIYDF